MSTHSDGEDSAMHDRDSIRSSTPSTPPLPAPSSPPSSRASLQTHHTPHHTLSGPGPGAGLGHPPTPTQSQSSVPGGQGGHTLGGHTLGGHGGQGGQGGHTLGGQVLTPAWANKRSTDEAEQYRDKLVDKGWNLRWLGDPLDESDMFIKK